MLLGAASFGSSELHAQVQQKQGCTAAKALGAGPHPLPPCAEGDHKRCWQPPCAALPWQPTAL